MCKLSSSYQDGNIPSGNRCSEAALIYPSIYHIQVSAGVSFQYISCYLTVRHWIQNWNSVGCTPGPVFYLQSWNPNHLEFSTKSIFTQSYLEAKSPGEIPSDFWQVLQYMCKRQSELSSLINHVFNSTGSDSSVGYLLVRGLLRCCIKRRHYKVDAWRHNSIDADAWRRQQRIGCYESNRVRFKISQVTWVHQVT